MKILCSDWLPERTEKRKSCFLNKTRFLWPTDGSHIKSVPLFFLNHILNVDLQIMCSACFAQRNRNRVYPSHSHGFQLRKIGAGIRSYVCLLSKLQCPSYWPFLRAFQLAQYSGFLCSPVFNSWPQYTVCFFIFSFPSSSSWLLKLASSIITQNYS